MPTKISKQEPPRGLSRILWRLPIWLYRLRLGWLLGERLLLLNHIGRKSGLPRQAVLEVVRYDKESDSYIVASGFGEKAQWYQNLLKTPHVTIQVGRRQLDVIADFLSPAEREAEMVAYAQQNPKLAQWLTRLIGYQVDGSEKDYRFIGREVIPFIAFRART